MQGKSFHRGTTYSFHREIVKGYHFLTMSINTNLNAFEIEGGPLLVINGVITSISRVITSVTHL